MENSAAIGREQNQSNIGVSLLAILIVLLSVIVAGAALALISYERAHANRIVPGVQVLGVQLGDMTRDEARAALGQPIAELEGRLLTLRHGDRRWTASAAELGLRYDLEAMLDHAIE